MIDDFVPNIEESLELDTHESYQSRGEKIVEMILANTNNLTFASLLYILKTRGAQVDEFIARETGGKTPIFSQEVLSSRIAQSYLRQTEKLGKLTPDREESLVASRDFNALLAYHYPVIIALAQKRAEEKYLPFEDILQIGIESILRQLPNFEGNHNRFAAWICIKIFGDMFRVGKEEYFEHMYIPPQTAIIVKKIEHLVENIQKNRQKPLSREEVLQELEKVLPDVTEKTRELALDILQRQYIPIELDALILEEVAYDQEHNGNKGYIEDPSEMVEVSQTYPRSLPNSIKEMLQELNPRHAEVLKLRYGFGREDEHSLSEVGERFGVGRSIPHQIEARALRKLRKASDSRGMGQFLNLSNKESQYDGFGLHDQHRNRRGIDIFLEGMQSGSIYGEDLLRYFLTLNPRFYEYFHMQSRMMNLDIISHIGNSIENDRMLQILNDFLISNSLSFEGLDVTHIRIVIKKTPALGDYMTQLVLRIVIRNSEGCVDLHSDGAGVSEIQQNPESLVGIKSLLIHYIDNQLMVEYILKHFHFSLPDRAISEHIDKILLPMINRNSSSDKKRILNRFEYYKKYFKYVPFNEYLKRNISF